MAEISSEEKLCFDDVLLEPQYSDLSSRSEADVCVKLSHYLKLSVPVISANMDTITGPDMAVAMHNCGGLGILHRYVPYDQVLQWISVFKGSGVIPVPSIGVQKEDYLTATIYREAGINVICVDVAHGHSKHTGEMVEHCKSLGFDVIAGNVATLGGAMFLANAGADVVKVGVGPGAVCQTRTITGHGVSQLSAIQDCVEVKNSINVTIIADGGIRCPADVVKAIGIGADAVMIGNLFAGCDETPKINGKTIYRGMASREAQIDFKGRVGNNVPEGVSLEVNPNGPVSRVVDELVGGLRSGMSYSGCRTIKEFQENAIFIRVSNNTAQENGPHALYRR
jgi:IMP dehydrogenase